MKLFYSPRTCSLASHIVLNELGMKFTLEKVDLKTKKTSSGDYTAQNPKSAVPALVLDNGELLTEGAVIMQYLADQKPESKLVPKAGTWERYRLMEWLNFIASDIHKNFSPLFFTERFVSGKEAQEQLRTTIRETLTKKFAYVGEQLKSKDFLLGSQFTVADAYLFNMLTWARGVQLDLSKWPSLMGFFERVQTRPSVVRTLEIEGKAH